jgi:hypothetical protein
MAGSGDPHSTRMRMCVACPRDIPSRVWRREREARGRTCSIPEAIALVEGEKRSGSIRRLKL